MTDLADRLAGILAEHAATERTTQAGGSRRSSST